MLAELVGRTIVAINSVVVENADGNSLVKEIDSSLVFQDSLGANRCLQLDANGNSSLVKVLRSSDLVPPWWQAEPGERFHLLRLDTQVHDEPWAGLIDNRSFDPTLVPVCPFLVQSITEWWTGPTGTEFMNAFVFWDDNGCPVLSALIGDDIELVRFDEIERYAETAPAYWNLHEVRRS